MKKAPSRKPNAAHILFEKHLIELNVRFEREFRFHTQRRWRFDYLIKPFPFLIAVEIEGGIYTQGRHTRGVGAQKDMDKYNAATMMGYRVLRFSTNDVLHGRAKAFLAEHLRQT